MLVLTRKIGEDIIIGDSVRVVVIDIRGEQVRLGVKAPPEIPVYRTEVYENIQKANREASLNSKTDPALELPPVRNRGSKPRKSAPKNSEGPDSSGRDSD